METTQDTAPSESTSRVNKKPVWLTLAKAVAILSVIVLIEVIMVSLLIPTSQETRAVAESLASSESSGEGEGSTSESADSEVSMLANRKMREVSLGSYHVLTYNPETGSSMNVDFDLYGTVLADEESEFLQLYDTNQVRIREQVLVTIRGSEVSDLSDAGLGLIKRQILEKTNRTLGKPLLHQVIFSEFSFIER